MTVQDFTLKYQTEFSAALAGIEADKAGASIAYPDALAITTEWLCTLQATGRKLILVGNGGSAGIASHMALDFWKNAHVKATAFNDSSLLTAMGNDVGFDNIFAKPISMFSEPGDVVLCISSSGSSPNILRAAEAAREKDCHVITLSGFSPENPLRSLGDLNFYVPAYSYGFAESIHQVIVHAMLDAKMYCIDGRNIFYKNQ